MSKIYYFCSWLLLISMTSSSAFAIDLNSLLNRPEGSGSSAEFFLGRNVEANITVNLIGGVNHSGIYHIPENTDLLTLVGAGGGATSYAELDNLKVRRRKGDGYEVLPVNLKRVMTESDKSLLRLQNGDVVFIPEDRSSSLNNTAAVIGIIGSILSVALSAYAVSQISSSKK